MTTYARLNPESLLFEQLVEVTPEHYDLLVANGKAAYLRQWVQDPEPTPDVTQIAVRGPIVIDATTARATWVLRDKTQAELDAAALQTEGTQLRNMIAALQASIAAPDVSGTAVERLTKLEARMVRTERICLYVLRRL